MEPADPRAHGTRFVAAREREGFDGAGTVLVGFREPDTHMSAVETVAANVAAFGPDEFTAPERPCVTDQQ